MARGSKLVALAVVALTLLALAGRLWGIGYGVPVWEEPDPDVPGHVDQLRGQPTMAGVEHPDQQYPHLLAQIARWTPARPDATGEGAPRTLDEHLAAASWTHVQVRELVAVLAVLLVPVTWLIARRFLSGPWALFAAALVATSLLHQSFAQQARPHGAAATFFALAVLADLHLARRGTVAAYLLASLATAAALATLHSALAVLIPGLAAHALRRGGGQRFFDVKLLIPIAASAAAIYLFYPFLFASSVEQHGSVGSGSLTFAEHTVALDEMSGRGFAVIGRVLWNYEPLLAALLALSVIAPFLRRREPGSEPTARAELLVVLAFALPYLAAIGLFELTYERFVLPLLPFAALAAAAGVSTLARRAGPVARVVIGCTAALSLALPAAACAKLAWLRASPDTLDEAAAWIREHGRGEPVYVSASQPFDLPLFRGRRGFRPFGERQLTPWTRWQAALSDAEREPSFDLRWLTAPSRVPGEVDMEAHLATLEPGLFVIERFEQRKRHAALYGLREALKRAGQPLACFSPDPDPERAELELFFQLSDHFNEGAGDGDWPHFTFRLLAARAIGPVVEIWRSPAGGGD